MIGLILSSLIMQHPLAALRTDENSAIAHQRHLIKAKTGKIDLYFLGDSITRRWGCADPMYASFLANWRENFFGWNAANFGWGGDTTANILWRIENGELDGVHPKVIVFLGGTNDVGAGEKSDIIVKRISRIVTVCQEKAPEATIILTAIFPRNDNLAFLPIIEEANNGIAKLVNGKRVQFLNINSQLADKKGILKKGVMQEDQLHADLPCYRAWADGLRPKLTELLGERAKTDLAPPPTLNPALEKKG